MLFWEELYIDDRERFKMQYRANVVPWIETPILVPDEYENEHWRQYRDATMLIMQVFSVEMKYWTNKLQNIIVYWVKFCINRNLNSNSNLKNKNIFDPTENIPFETDSSLVVLRHWKTRRPPQLKKKK